ncbi:MAG: trigger factor [Candidatus Phytoplasma stylosanthis]|nr:trigger factor [Candidatus Phytoplasma stylosanthis]
MQVEKINNDFIRYNFQISSNEFDIFLERAFQKIKHKVKIRGFRKGYVTRKIFEKYFEHESLYMDAFEILVQDKFQEILQNQDYDFIGNPKIVNFKKDDLINKKNFFNFSLELLLKPKIKLCDYKKIEIIVSQENTTEEDIQEKMEFLLKKNPFLEDKKKEENFLEWGDFAVFDFEGYLDEKLFEGSCANNYTLEIGSNKFIPGFEKKMLGMKINERREFKIKFPDDYFNKELTSKEIVFKIFLHQIKVKKDLVWNDELVQILKFPNIKNLQELKNKLKMELDIQKKNKKEKEQKEKILDFLIHNSEITKIPSCLVEEEVKSLIKEIEEELQKKNINLEKYLNINNFTNEEFKQKIEEKALINVQLNLLLDEISLKEKINISSEELDICYERLRDEFKVDIEKVKQNSLFHQNIINNLIREKTANFLFEVNIKQ